jgi:hypothetical protein
MPPGLRAALGFWSSCRASIRRKLRRLVEHHRVTTMFAVWQKAENSSPLSQQHVEVAALASVIAFQLPRFAEREQSNDFTTH